jgi:BlaI family transcriptional regulator, penicillinase repressor
MPAHAETLTRREREIMNAIFALGNRATAEDIRGRLPSPPSSSAVRTMLSRLEAKGQLRHQNDAGRYVYSARVSPADARRAALRQYLRTFFNGSRGQMMTALLRQESWTDEELTELLAAIEARRGKSST